jgi:uncharacterized protein (DUF342 family)
MTWEGTQYFSVRISKNGMSAFIPKGTALDPALSGLDYPTFIKFLKAQHEIEIEPQKSILDEIKASAKHNPYGFKNNFEICVGVPPKEGKLGQLNLIKRDGTPHDMVLSGVPFLQYVHPIPPEDGRSVTGQSIPAPKLVDPLNELILPDEMEMNSDGKVIPSASGQAELNGNVVTFKPVYRVGDPADPMLQSTEFYCSVWVPSDLAGSMHWRIFGSLQVDGHLSAGNIEVHGNLEVKLGIQTNFEGTIRVHGTARTGYLQMTRIGVGDALVVERGILQSEIRAGNLVRCLGAPGAIQGSKVFCLGSIQANRAGSEQGIVTELVMPYVRQTRPIKIAAISSGTKITFKDKGWSASGTSAFSAQPEDNGQNNLAS